MTPDTDKRAVPSLRERIAVAVYEVRGHNAASEALIDRVMAALASEGTPPHTHQFISRGEDGYPPMRCDICGVASVGTPSSEGLRVNEATCWWCGVTLHPIAGVWTDDVTNSGDYCSEGRAVGRDGTSPHWPTLAATTGSDSPERLDRDWCPACRSRVSSAGFRHHVWTAKHKRAVLEQERARAAAEAGLTETEALLLEVIDDFEAAASASETEREGR